MQSPSQRPHVFIPSLNKKFSVLLGWANAIKVWTNDIKMTLIALAHTLIALTHINSTEKLHRLHRSSISNIWNKGIDPRNIDLCSLIYQTILCLVAERGSVPNPTRGTSYARGTFTKFSFLVGSQNKSKKLFKTWIEINVNNG